MFAQQCLLAGGGSGVDVMIPAMSGSFDTGNVAGTFTYSNAPIGPAHDDKWVGVILGIRGNTNIPDVTGFTVGGVSASHTTDQVNTSGIDHGLRISLFRVITGSTADIVVIMSGTGGKYILIPFYFINAASNPIHDTGQANAASTTVDVPSQGFVVGAYNAKDITDSLTWTGLTEKVDEEITTSDSTFVGGASDALTTETARAISVAGTGAENHAIIAQSYAHTS